MTGIGRLAYKKTRDAIVNGDMTVADGVTSIIHALDELDAFYQLKGEKVLWIGKVRNKMYKTYMYLYNMAHR